MVSSACEDEDNSLETVAFGGGRRGPIGEITSGMAVSSCGIEVVIENAAGDGDREEKPKDEAGESGAPMVGKGRGNNA